MAQEIIYNLDDQILAEYEAERIGGDRTLRVNRSGNGTIVDPTLYEEISLLGDNVLNATKDFGADLTDEFIAPATKGIVKLVDNTLLPLAVSKYSVPRTALRMLGYNDKNAVADYVEYFDEQVYPRLEVLAKRYGREGKPSTVVGKFVEPLAQYGTPGVSFYNFLSKILVKGSEKFINRALQKSTVVLGSEAGVVAVAQDPEEGNFATAVSDLFGIEKKETDGFMKEFFDYLADPADQTTAETMFESKAKAFLADVPVAITSEVLITFFGKFGKMLRVTDVNNPTLRQGIAQGALGVGVGGTVATTATENTENNNQDTENNGEK